MNKKAMGVSQVFIYLMAIITFALIMIFGFKAIFGFTSDVKKIEFVQFKTGLENSIKQIYSEYGAVRIEEFSLPATYQQICFVDLDIDPYDPLLCGFDPLACAIWEDSNGFQKEEENVFLVPPSEVKIKVSRIEMDGGFVCVPIRNGKFSLILEGQGDSTKISKLS